MTDQPPGLPPQVPPPAAPPVAPPPVAAPAPVPQYAAPQQAPAAAPQYGYVPASNRPGPMPGVYFSGNPARLIAWILDGFILSIIATILWVIVGLVIGLIATAGSDTATSLSLFVGILVVSLFTLFYYPFWWSRSGQSPGKKIMHIKVVRADNGQLISFGRGILRLFGYWVSAVVFYIGFLWILVDNRRQGWADKIAGTYVIEVP
jgi:uncharacterized RDD family membrane protein YckC